MQLILEFLDILLFCCIVLLSKHNHNYLLLYGIHLLLKKKFKPYLLALSGAAGAVLAGSIGYYARRYTT